MSFAHARTIIEEWHRDDNEQRPKKNLGKAPPAAGIALSSEYEVCDQQRAWVQKIPLSGEPYDNLHDERGYGESVTPAPGKR